MSESGRAYGVTRKTMERRLLRLGVVMCYNGKMLADAPDEKVIAAYERLQSCTSVAREFKSSRKTVEKRLKKLGVVLTGRRGPRRGGGCGGGRVGRPPTRQNAWISQAPREEVMECYNRVKTGKAVAKEFGCSLPTACARLRAEGVDLGPNRGIGSRNRWRASLAKRAPEYFDDDACRAAYERLKTSIAVAREFKVHPAQMCVRLRGLGYNLAANRGIYARKAWEEKQAAQ